MKILTASLFTNNTHFSDRHTHFYATSAFSNAFLKNLAWSRLYNAVAFMISTTISVSKTLVNSVCYIILSACWYILSYLIQFWPLFRLLAHLCFMWRIEKNKRENRDNSKCVQSNVCNLQFAFCISQLHFKHIQNYIRLCSHASELYRK